MRVQNPLTYGEKLLSLVLPKERYTEAKLESMFGGSEININFPKFIPVHLTYQTAFVDDAGKLQLREDVYGRDAKMIAILKSSERKVADIAVERAPNTSSKPVRMPVGMYGGGRRLQLWRRQQLLRLAVQRTARASLSAARGPDLSAQQRQRPLQLALDRRRALKQKTPAHYAGVFLFAALVVSQVAGRLG